MSCSCPRSDCGASYWLFRESKKIRATNECGNSYGYARYLYGRIMQIHGSQNAVLRLLHQPNPPRHEGGSIHSRRFDMSRN